MADLFPDAPQQVSLKDQIAEVAREVAMRKRVYPRRVADKKMSQAAADRQIATMAAVLETMRALAHNSATDR